MKFLQYCIYLAIIQMERTSKNIIKTFKENIYSPLPLLRSVYLSSKRIPRWVGVSVAYAVILSFVINTSDSVVGDNLLTLQVSAPETAIVEDLPVTEPSSEVTGSYTKAPPTMDLQILANVLPAETAPAPTTTAAPVTSIIAVEPPPPISVPDYEQQVVPITDTGSFSFITYGWGHGVGLSQNGANYYAKYGGYNYRQILEHYYPGVTIANTGLSDELFTIDGETVSALEAVAGVVNAEVGPSFNDEAIKAQAVAAYTIFKYNNNDAHGLHMKTPIAENVYQLTAEVLGEACYWQEDYAMTVFSASCGANTANSQDLGWTALPYLQSVPSEFDAAYDPHFGTVTIIAAAEVRTAIENYFGITLSTNPENWFNSQRNEVTGYVTAVTIDGQITVNGTKVESALGLKSSNFEVLYGY